MTFGVRGLIEGFYDRLWTWDERARVADFVAAHGFGTYVYAPKEERAQNGGWRDGYPEPHRRALAAFGERCRDAGMELWIGLRPVGISYVDDADIAVLVERVEADLALGPDRVVLLADDIPTQLDPPSSDRFDDLSAAHAWLVSLVLRHTALTPERLVFVPTHYAGHGSPYLRALGAQLPLEVDLCWTGSDVVVPTIGSDEAVGMGAVLRRPPLVWDNYPVNDAGMVEHLHVGPIRGRAPDLDRHVRGVLVNPALQPMVTLIPLATWGEYLRDPSGYDPEAAWGRALAEVAGSAMDAEAVALVARAFDRSVLRRDWAPPADGVRQAASAAVAVLANRRLADDLRPFVDR